MPNIEQAVERIKSLECPTGDVEQRVAGILEEYGVANKNEIMVSRNEKLDENEAQAYVTKIPGMGEQSIVVLAVSGMDDYVAKVVDVYMEEPRTDTY